MQHSSWCGSGWRSGSGSFVWGSWDTLGDLCFHEEESGKQNQRFVTMKYIVQHHYYEWTMSTTGASVSSRTDTELSAVKYV